MNSKAYRYLKNATMSLSLLCCLSCNDSFLGCNSTTSPDTCGSVQQVTLTKTLTVGDPSFYLESPASSSSSTCEAHFYIQVSMANLDSAKLLGFDAIPVNLSNAFQVRATDGTGGVFAKDQEWTLQQINSGGVYKYLKIDFKDHNSQTPFSSKYFITFGLNSNNLGDSVLVQASITSYAPQ